ncbi:hypothetical protein DIURU_003642 [Diutina rugosa]|uniref:Uncharacterized protein n=1 Tax=Diutina rugosa TaxID=5481 RepID=A0A642ULA4_DIURU|nr:uncharacterized protein DIURU_003642 [Diutina rugosa]KAA8901272.1 hypothetical protein DIURU_003642 [Diutina rugosa]
MQQVQRDLENVKDEMASLKELSSIATTPTLIELLDEKQSYPESSRIYSTPAETKSVFDSVKKENGETGSDDDDDIDLLRKRVDIWNTTLNGRTFPDSVAKWYSWLLRYKDQFKLWLKIDYKEAAWSILKKVPTAYVPEYSKPDNRRKCLEDLLAILKLSSTSNVSNAFRA